MGNQQGKPKPPPKADTSLKQPSIKSQKSAKPTSPSPGADHTEPKSFSSSTSLPVTTPTSLLTRQDSTNAQVAASTPLVDVVKPATTTNEGRNFCWMAKLLYGICNSAMRDILRLKIGQSEVILTQAICQNSHKLTNLTPIEKDKLFPPNNVPVRYDSLDWSLLYKIARNVCGEKIQKNKKKWGKPPDPTDKSLFAAIETIRCSRNDIFAHATVAKIQQQEFDNHWKRLEGAVKIMDQEIGGKIHYITEMSKIKKDPLDPSTEVLIAELVQKDKRISDMREIEEESDAKLTDLLNWRDQRMKDIWGEEKIFGSAHTRERSATDKNLVQTETFLCKHAKKTKYYVQTKTFHETEQILKLHGHVLIIGPPGEGKSDIGIQLMFKYTAEKWNVRKLNHPTDVNHIDTSKKELIFIDDIFDDCDLSTLKCWWKAFNNLKQMIPEDVGMEKNTCILMTSRSHLFTQATVSMRKSHSMLKHVIKITSNTLSDTEKEEILQKRIEFSKEHGVSTLKLSNNEKETILRSQPPLGFPLCAHLFAFELRYQKHGVDFFENPVEYMHDQIKQLTEGDYAIAHEILLILMLVHAIKQQSMDLENVEKCHEILHTFCLDEVIELPLQFDSLKEVAGEHCETFLCATGKHKYEFYHQSVQEAVQQFFIEKYFVKAIALLPLSVILNKIYVSGNCIQPGSVKISNDKCDDFSDIKDTACKNQYKLCKFDFLATRLLKEITSGNISETCTYSVFKDEKFVKHLYDSLKILYNFEEVQRLLKRTDQRFPVVYWLIKNDALTMGRRILSLIKKKKDNEKRKTSNVNEEEVDDKKEKLALLLRNMGVVPESSIGSAIQGNKKDSKIEEDLYNQQTVYAIFAACSNRSCFSFIEKTLQSNFEINSCLGCSFKEYNHESFLHVACSAWNEDIVLLLLRNKAIFCHSCWEGWPVLHMAAVYNETQLCCRDLLRAVERFEISKSTEFEQHSLKSIKEHADSTYDFIVYKLHECKKEFTKVMFCIVEMPFIQITENLIETFHSLPDVVQFKQESDIAPLNIQDEKGNTILHSLIKSRIINIRQISEEETHENEDSNSTKVQDIALESQESFIDEFTEDYKNNDLQTIQLLLKKGASLNVQNKVGLTPLMLEISRFYPEMEIIRCLLKGGADVNALDSRGRSVLHFLTSHNYDKRIEVHALIAFLIRKGCSVNEKDCAGNTPLFNELRKEVPDPQIVETFTSSKHFDPSAVDKHDNTAMHICLFSSHNKEEGYSIDTVLNHLLNDQTDIYKQNIRNETPLSLLLSNIRLYKNVLRKMISTKNCKFPLNYCIKQEIEEWNKKDALIAMLETGLVNPDEKDEQGRTLLINAAIHCPEMSEIVKFLIHTGIDINAADDSGNTALHYLIASPKDFDQREAALKILISAQPNVHVKNKQLKSVMQHALLAVVRTSELFKEEQKRMPPKDTNVFPSFTEIQNPQLLGTSIDVNVLDIRMEILELLLELCTSTIDESDLKSGRTYLHYCASSRLSDNQILSLCQLLVMKGGIEIEKRDDDGVSCVEVAFKYCGRKLNTLAFLFDNCKSNNELNVDKMLQYLADSDSLTTECVQFLTQNVLPVSRREKNLFHYLAKIGYDFKYKNDVFNLLSTVFPINTKNRNGKTPLHVYIGGNCRKECVVNFLLLLDKESADTTDNEKNSSLHLAILSNRNDSEVCAVVKELIKLQCNLNIQNENGKTPIMEAVRCRNARYLVLMELIKAGANLKLTDRKDFTVLHHCIDCQKDDFTSSKMLKELLKVVKIPLLNWKSKEGLTPLNLATTKKKFSRVLCILTLLSYDGCKVETTDIHGRSPIYNSVHTLKGLNKFVVLERMIRVCILRIHGGDVYAADDEGQNVWHICEKYNDTLLREMLKKDEEDMVHTLKKAYRNVTDFDKGGYEIKPVFSSEIMAPLQLVIQDAVEYLSHRELDFMSTDTRLSDEQDQETTNASAFETDP